MSTKTRIESLIDAKIENLRREIEHQEYLGNYSEVELLKDKLEYAESVASYGVNRGMKFGNCNGGSF